VANPGDRDSMRRGDSKQLLDLRLEGGLCVNPPRFFADPVNTSNMTLVDVALESTGKGFPSRDARSGRSGVHFIGRSEEPGGVAKWTRQSARDASNEQGGGGKRGVWTAAESGEEGRGSRGPRKMVSVLARRGEGRRT
jgi:hypothetical protein